MAGAPVNAMKDVGKLTQDMMGKSIKKSANVRLRLLEFSCWHSVDLTGVGTLKASERLSHSYVMLFRCWGKARTLLRAMTPRTCSVKA